MASSSIQHQDILTKAMLLDLADVCPILTILPETSTLNTQRKRKRAEEPKAAEEAKMAKKPKIAKAPRKPRETKKAQAPKGAKKTEIDNSQSDAYWNQLRAKSNASGNVEVEELYRAIAVFVMEEYPALFNEICKMGEYEFARARGRWNWMPLTPPPTPSPPMQDCQVMMMGASQLMPNAGHQFNFKL